MTMNDSECLQSIQRLLQEPIFDHLNNTQEQPLNNEQEKDVKPLLTTYKHRKPYEIYTNNSFASINDTLKLIQLVNTTARFVIHTEQRCKRNRSVLFIKIQLIRSDEPKTTIILFSVDYRLSIKNELLSRIQTLIKAMFIPGKLFYFWEYNQEHLYSFAQYYDISQTIFNNLFMTALQDRFKHWYNGIFKHIQPCPIPREYPSDDMCCTCSHRPYKNFNDKWTIEDAIFYVFEQLLIPSKELILKSDNDLINMASTCSALSQLAKIINLDMTIGDLQDYKRSH